MHSMIRHHEQALVMAAMVPSRSKRDDLKLLAERIEVSQKDEIRLMQRWLRANQAAAHGGDMSPHSASAHHQMPGMLTDGELASLAAATSEAFDKLFLQLMIRHHEGALTMVTQLFSAAGAAQTSEMYAFATDVDNDQRAEIARMRKLLAALGTR